MLTFFVVVPVLIAVLLFTLATNRIVRMIAIMFQSALFAASVYLVRVTRDADLYTIVGSYENLLGITLRASSLSAVLVLLTTFIFLVVTVYSFVYEEQDAKMFWFLMFILEAAFIGLFLSGDLFNIFVLIEVSTLVTVILAMYDRKNRNIFHGKIFLMTNLVSVQFFLLGLGYVYRLTGAMDIIRVTESLAGLDPTHLRLPYVLIMTAVAFKNTLIPFFSWTPKVRIYPQAPTVVAAVMSGLQAKTSIYLFITFQDVFGPIAAHEIFLVIGIITGVFGAYMAICQTNIKNLLAYSTVSQTGMIIVGFSLQTQYAHIGGLYHIISHAMFKTALFLCAGIIIRSYGTADLNKIRGVLRRMPVVGTATVAAVLGIVGAPLFIGSVSKYFIFEGNHPGMMALSIAMSLGTMVMFVKFSTIFFGQSDLKGISVVPEGTKAIPVVVMGVLCLLGGVLGTRLIYFLFRYVVVIDAWNYLYKSLIFIAVAVVGYLIYEKGIKKRAIFVRMGAANASFKMICASMGVFLASMLILVGLV